MFCRFYAFFLRVSGEETERDTQESDGKTGLPPGVTLSVSPKSLFMR